MERIKIVQSAFVVLATLYNLTANGQIQGKVTNSQGEAIPYASVYVKEAMQGAPTNEKGEYRLNLMRGNYDICFQAIGYKSQIRSVKITAAPVTLNITLDNATYELKEVVISNKNNPADRIIRKAISNGLLYRNKLSSYSSDVYFKSNLKVSKISRIIKWMVPKETKLPVEGKVYTMEMVNKLYYKNPDSYTQRTISLRTNFPDDDFSIPGIGIYRNNIYNDTFFGSASPLGRSAFTFYKFQLVGSAQHGGGTIYKIAFTPRKDAGIYFSGLLYIADNDYNITNAELTTSFSNIKYVFSISYAMINNTIPMPTTIGAKMSGSIMGNEFAMNMTSAAKYISVETNGGAANPAKLSASTARQPSKKHQKNAAKREAIEKKLEELTSKDNMSLKEMKQVTALVEKKEEMDDTLKNMEESNIKVVKDSLFNTQDSTFWNRIRLIPLSEEELKYSHETDSLTSLIPKGVAAPKDTTGNKAYWRVSSMLIGGNIYKQRNTRLFSSGFILGQSSYFTPVDGFTLANKFDFETLVDSSHKLNITLKPMYSFARKTGMGSTAVKYSFNPRRMGYITLNGIWATSDINAESPIDRFPNSASALLFKENFMKTVAQKGISITFATELTNGLSIQLTGGFDCYHLLNNQSNFSFLYTNRVFTSNSPYNIYDNGNSWQNHQQSTLQMKISYMPSPRYRYDKRGYKYYLSHNKPTFSIKAEQGLPAWNSSSSYTNIEMGAVQNIAIQMFNQLSYTVKAGTFFNSKGLQLTSFYHPNTVYIPFGFTNSINTFTLLPYYKYATPGSYAEGHVTYKAQSLLLKQLPFLSKKLFSENISVGYYTTSRYKNYTEISYGLSNLLFMGGISVTTSFESGRYSSWGIKGYFQIP